MPLTRDRLRAAFLASALTAGIGYALIIGLGVDFERAPERALQLFEVRPPPPVREFVTPPLVRNTAPEGRAAPPNLHARPKEIVAPPPIVPPPAPPPILAAPIADIGPAQSSGATDRPGPGTGAGGVGNGRGAGGSGDGTGGGRVARRFRHLSGEVTDDDQPEWMREAGMRGLVVFNFGIDADGRVTACTVTESSGHPALDDLTCRLFRQRLRFRPSLDASGRPVPDRGTGEIGWDAE